MDETSKGLTNMMKKVYFNELTKGTTNTEALDMNANRLKTEEEKIH